MTTADPPPLGQFNASRTRASPCHRRRALACGARRRVFFKKRSLSSIESECQWARKALYCFSSAARSGIIWMTLGFADCSTSCVRMATLSARSALSSLSAAFSAASACLSALSLLISAAVKISPFAARSFTSSTTFSGSTAPQAHIVQWPANSTRCRFCRSARRP